MSVVGSILLKASAMGAREGSDESDGGTSAPMGTGGEDEVVGAVEDELELEEDCAPLRVVGIVESNGRS